MEELLEILNDIKPGVDFKNSANLVDSGTLDSLSIIRLVSEIDDEFDVEISVPDIIPENFNSVDGMMKMIERLQSEE